MNRSWSPRVIVAAVLLGFVLVAMGVIARRSYGIDQQRTIRDLERQRDALEAERMRVRGEIRDSSSLARLAPILQRMDMHIPADSMVIDIPRPRPHDPK